MKTFLMSMIGSCDQRRRDRADGLRRRANRCGSWGDRQRDRHRPRDRHARSFQLYRRRADDQRHRRTGRQREQQQDRGNDRGAEAGWGDRQGHPHVELLDLSAAGLRQGKLPRILGYQVSNNITVRRDNISEAGKLLQAALNAGVNQSSGLQFEVSDPARGRDQAMRAAYDEAKSKAVLLAQAAGRTLGRALAISEGGAVAPPYPVPRAMAMRAESVVSEVPVEAGSQDVSYSISVVFELR